MKLSKIISSKAPTSLEDNINEWLKDNQDKIIIKTNLACEGNTLVYVILYETDEMIDKFEEIIQKQKNDETHS